MVAVPTVLFTQTLTGMSRVVDDVEGVGTTSGLPDRIRYYTDLTPRSDGPLPSRAEHRVCVSGLTPGLKMLMSQTKVLE